MTQSIQKDALLARFSELAYRTESYLNNSANLPAGWRLADWEIKPPFAAFAFRNDATDEVVVAYRGTDGLKDASADVAIFAGSWNAQFRQGMDFVTRLRANEDAFPEGYAPTKVLVTGHSLGGAIAQVASQAFGFDGAAMDPGAAARIVQTAEFRAAAVAAGVPASGIGMPASFKNWLVAGSIVSSGSGVQLGSTSYVPSLGFSSQQALTAFLVGMLSPMAGIGYAVGIDQAGNKHASAQISSAMRLVAGMGDDEGSSSLSLSPRVVDWSLDPATGEQKPIYSQTEFEVKTSSGELQSVLTFSGTGADRTLEVRAPSGELQSTISVTQNGSVISVSPVREPSIEIRVLPETLSNSDGSITTIARDFDGDVTSTSVTRTFDDGSSLVTTQLSGGAVRVVSRDTGGNVTSIREEQSVGSLTVTRISDINGTLVETRRLQAFEDGSSMETVSRPDGYELRTMRDSTGIIKQVEVPPYAQTFGGALLDATSLISALKSGQPLPQLASGLKLLNTLDRDHAIPGLGTASTIAQGALSIVNLHNAFGGGGGDLDKVSATGSAIFAVDAALKAADVALPALSTAANTIAPYLPPLAIINSIKNNDPVGVALGVGMWQSGAAFLGTPLGWGLLVTSIARALEEPPEAWGIGTFTFSAGGTTLELDAQGESFGIDRVRQLMQGNGQSPTLPDGSPNPSYFGGVQGYLEQIIDSAAQADPGRALGLIPQRLPTLSWHEARQDEPGYALTDIDPVTGEQRYPHLRYNDDWSPYNADATDPEQRRNIFERLIVSALERGAIAPLWEVRTAKLQQDGGDPLAGLTEEERAARRGLMAPIDPAIRDHAPGEFRPVALDLDGDGRIMTIANADTERSFNWDGSGFDKQVGWVGDGEGLLYVDRNPNGAIDAGKELFSNSLVADAAKGVRSLAWVDANGDGLIDAADPVFGELKVWQDTNASATLDDGEARTLGELGITQLDYANNRYTRNGQLHALQSPTLETSAEGQRVSVIPEGIRVQFSNGKATLFVTRVTDLGAGNDGVDMLEDGGQDYDAQGQPIGQSPARQDPVSIAPALLLANDHVGTSSSGLTITAVGNASAGSVSINASTGAIEFLAPLHFNGTATFEYTVTAASGQSEVATVTVNVAPVNDRPDVRAVLPDRAIYGWGPLVQRRLVGGGEGGTSEEITITAHQGEPFYAPYHTVAGRRLVEKVSGGGEGGPISMWVETGPVLDTTISKSYFDSEWAKVQAGQWSAENPAPTYLEFKWDGERYRVQGAPGAYLHDTPIASEPGNDGHVTVTDVDGGGGTGYRYEIYSQPLYGRLGGDGAAVDIDPATGAFSYEGRRYVAHDEGGYDIAQNVYTDKHARAEWDGDPSKAANWDSFTVKVVDLSDPSGNTFTLKDVTVPHFGPQPSPDVQSGGKKPIAIDLNGDGFHFTDVDDSNVFFDVNGDGWRRRMAWNNPQDGFIAFDKDGDGKINDFDELSFVPYRPDGQTDLGALRAFDSNGDGVFSAADEKWAAFGVWQDANSDGVSDAGEFKSMADLGIQSVALASDGRFQVIDGQTVHGTGVAMRTDGSTLAVADVTLRYRNETLIATPDGGTAIAPVPSFQPGTEFDGTAEPDLVLGTTGSDMFRTGGGNDVIHDDLGNDGVQAGAGDDLIYTGADNDIVDGGAGNDTSFLGVGNDVAFGDDGDDLLMLEGGNDVAFGGAGQDFIAGGDGNDAISGDAGDDKLFGEGGWDALFGKDGDDELWGMDGNDLLDGGEGRDVLAGGAGDDAMEGGLGDDTYELGSVGDTVVERAGEGDDTVRASIGYTLGAELENLTLTGIDAREGTGNELANVLVGNDAANTLYGLAGNDTLDGGRGADTLIGGSGDDTYVVDDALDRAVEAAGEGIDTVRSRITTTLAANVENLTLIGLGTIDGTGNALDNVLVGNAAANTLDGGAGADEMRGGRGDDRYVVDGNSNDSASDRVVELAGEGYDTVVLRGASYLVLPDHVEAAVIEHYTGIVVGNASDNLLTAPDGQYTLMGEGGDDVLIGGVGSNGLYGGDGNDVLRAGDALPEFDSGESPAHTDDELVGGKGNDILYGGSGFDIYGFTRGDGHDVIHDASGGGIEFRFEEDRIAWSDLRFSMADDDLVIDVLHHGEFVGDRMTLVDWGLGGPRVSWVEGGRLDESLFNEAPVPTPDQARIDEDQVAAAVGNVLLNDTDPDQDDHLSVAGPATMQGLYGTLDLATDGQYAYALDNSLHAVQSLGAGATLRDTFDYVVTDDAASPRTATSSLSVTIAGTNDAPALLSSLQDAEVKVLRPIDVGVQPSVVFADVDAGDVLSYAARLAGGQPLPHWLRFDTAAALQFSGQAPRSMKNQRLDVQIVATDPHGAAVVAPLALLFDAVGNTVLGTDGDDVLVGSDLDDRLLGLGGNDVLDGAEGEDTMDGGAGDDAYVVDHAGDTVVEQAFEGFDRVSAGIDYVLPEHVEQLNLSGAALHGTGNSLDNLLFGNELANVLDGGAGADQLNGGAGDDRYVIDDAADAVVEAAAEGTDTVFASVDATLAPNVEHLVLIGSAALAGTGNGEANVLVGNAGANALAAGAGNDVLAGALGDDRLDGGAGDDLYLYAQGEGRDSITDGSGVDTLRFGAGLTLDALAARHLVVGGESRTFISVLGADGQETQQGVELVLGANGASPIERFELGDGRVVTLDQLLIGARTIAGGGGTDTLTGDRSDDTVNAGSGNDTVYGRWGHDTLRGGSGIDMLFGEGGDDRLFGESENDELWGGAGTDLLDGGSGRDVLMGGAGFDQLFGGTDADMLDGGSGNDTLDGSSGEDELYGGEGDDALDGGTDGDLLAAGAGNDAINAGAGRDVVVAGAGHDSVNAGADADFVDGGDGDDTISVGGGADFVAAGRGNDTLDLGQDRDVIAFNRGDGADTVSPFASQRDALSLGGGIRYADLALRKSGDDLVLELGQDDRIILEGWYADDAFKGLATLQVVTGASTDHDAASADRLRNRKVVAFDFAKIVSRFDAARAADPSLGTWGVASVLDAAYANGSNTQAIGGDLAWRYATTGGYGDLDWRAVRNRLAGLGASNWQSLTSVATTVNPWTALQAGISLVADKTVGLPSPITPVAPPTHDELAVIALGAGQRPTWLQQAQSPLMHG